MKSHDSMADDQFDISDVNKIYSDGTTALCHSIVSKDYEAVEYLLGQCNADPNCFASYSYPPLVFALIMKDKQLIKILLERNDIDVNARGRGNITALYLACHWGEIDIVQALLKAGADPCILAKLSKDGKEYRQSALYIAIVNNHVHIARELILSNPQCIHIPDMQGVHPIHLAAESGYVGLIQLMIEMGQDINIPYQGRSPLYIATQNGHKRLVRLLLDNGADYQVILSLPSNGRASVNSEYGFYFLSPLSAAVQKNYKECVDILSAYPHRPYLIRQALRMTYLHSGIFDDDQVRNSLYGKLLETVDKIRNDKLSNMRVTKNIPKIIHFIYLNEIPIEYIFGGNINSGLFEVCKKAALDGYKVNLWVPDRNKVNKQLLTTRSKLNSLIDSSMFLALPNLRIRNLDELNSEMELYFTEANDFDASFLKDLKMFVNSEMVKDFNLAAASNIFRLIILALKGGIYCDLSKTFPKGVNLNNFHFDNLIKQVEFGFAQDRETNSLLVSQKKHGVVIETLKIIVDTYRLIYKVSFNNLQKNTSNTVEVITGQDTLHVNTHFRTKDPLKYSRCQKSRDFRTSSTELISGVYPIKSGKLLHLISLYKQLNNEFNYEMKNSILKDNLYHEYWHDIPCSIDNNVIKLIDAVKSNLYSGVIPSKYDWSIYPHPLACFKEKAANQDNWRKPKKVFHKEGSIHFLLGGINRGNSAQATNKSFSFK